MIREGHIVLFAFPYTDQAAAKLRPALILRQCPGSHEDWLLCMVSTQLRQAVPDLDEVMLPEDEDFGRSGLKQASVFRLSRLAIVSADILQGSIGSLSESRLDRMRSRIANWIVGAKVEGISLP